MNMQLLRSFQRMAAASLVLLIGLPHLAGCASSPKAAQTQTPPPQATKTAEPTPNPTSEPSSQIKAEHKPIPFEQVLKEEEQRKATKQKQTQAKTTKAKPKATQPAVKKPKPEAKAEQEIASKKTAPKPESAPKPEPIIAKPKVEATTEVQQAETIKSALPTETVKFTLDQLPITIGENWVLKTDLSTCSLQTQTQSLDDGAGLTPVTLILSKSSWLLKTKSDIDLSYSNTGIKLDNGAHFDLEKLTKETNIEFTRQRQAMVDALGQANIATLSVGFWPTWPVTAPKTLDIPVAQFNQAYQAWQNCNQMLSAR